MDDKLDDKWPEFGICESTVHWIDLFIMYHGFRLICLFIFLCIINILRYNILTGKEKVKMTDKGVQLTIALSIMILPLSNSCFATVCAWISIIIGYILSQVTNNHTQPPGFTILSSLLGLFAVFFVFTGPICVPYKFTGSIATAYVFIASLSSILFTNYVDCDWRVNHCYQFRIITMTMLMIPLFIMPRNIYFKETFLSEFVNQTEEFSYISFFTLFIYRFAEYAVFRILKVSEQTAEILVAILTIFLLFYISLIIVTKKFYECCRWCWISFQHIIATFLSPIAIVSGYFSGRVAMIDVIYFVIYLGAVFICFSKVLQEPMLVLLAIPVIFGFCSIYLVLYSDPQFEVILKELHGRSYLNDLLFREEVLRPGLKKLKLGSTYIELIIN
eukprot:GHVR01175221.1.p1 GENE.GHVR01175221.1~~GHVR01175221.1.p1  ORF type:complete len:388 (+),score=-0.22 GHVR01175221.1:286-1449(+)